MKVYTLIILTIAIATTLIIGSLSFPYWTADTKTITIESKEVMTSGGNGKYLIFTDSEVYQNTDCWARGKFRSSDLYRKLKVGNTYKVNVYGWRIPFLSAYKNIVSINETNEPELVK